MWQAYKPGLREQSVTFSSFLPSASFPECDVPPKIMGAARTGRAEPRGVYLGLFSQSGTLRKVG